jgi:hypothetical protein
LLELIGDVCRNKKMKQVRKGRNNDDDRDIVMKEEKAKISCRRSRVASAGFCYFE